MLDRSNLDTGELQAFVQRLDVRRPAIKKHPLRPRLDGLVGRREHESRPCAFRVGRTRYECPDEVSFVLMGVSRFQAEVGVAAERPADVGDVRIGPKTRQQRHGAIIAPGSVAMQARSPRRATNVLEA